MTAVINFEYFISPMLCQHVNLNDHVDSMRVLNEMILHGGIDVMAESSIMSKMIDENYYPCDKVLNNMFPKGAACVFSPQDVAKLINKIISNIQEFNSEVSAYEFDWGDFIIEPPLNPISIKRGGDLSVFLKDLLVRSVLFNSESTIFYNQAKNKSDKLDKFNLSGVVTECFPSLPHGISNNLACSVHNISDARDYFYRLDAKDLYSRANTNLALKCSLYCGCIEIIKRNSLDLELSWDAFKIGQDFLDSLIRNQAAYTQPYSSVVFETIIYVLCRHPKNEVLPFRKSAKSQDQRTLGDLKAYRTHITDAHQALRLMFWVEPDKTIILANIGPKFEESISNP